MVQRSIPNDGITPIDRPYKKSLFDSYGYWRNLQWCIAKCASRKGLSMPERSIEHGLTRAEASHVGESRVARPGPRTPVGLALQGGGSWGAYTWGVLDSMLGSRRVRIAQLSGTSAGAINA